MVGHLNIPMKTENNRAENGETQTRRNNCKPGESKGKDGTVLLPFLLISPTGLENRIGFCMLVVVL